MTNELTLVSLAMLKVNLDKNEKDYIDYLSPFIIFVLNEKRPSPVIDSTIQKHLNEEFGLSIPSSVIQSVLWRLEKREYLKKINRVYEISKDLPPSSIPQERATANRHINQVIMALRKYASTLYKLTWSDEYIVNILSKFISQFSIEFLGSYIKGKPFPDIPPATPQDWFVVNSFIRDAIHSQAELFNSIIILVKGHMLANALLCTDLRDVTRKFQSVTFYFDTPLILQLLSPP